MRTTFLTCGLFILTLVVSSRARAATPAQIDNAIAKAKAFVYAQQQKDGTWELVPHAEPLPPKAKLPIKQSVQAGQWGGRTAIAVYALLAAGENPQDPRLEKAIAFLERAETNGVYVLGVRCQVWLLLPQTPDVRNRMKADAQELMRMAKSEGKARGMYDYVPTKDSPEYSHSRSQYAVLGVWAAQQAGIEIPSTYWKLVEESWTRNQEPDGGWTYTAGSTAYPTTPGMTAAGVATLFEVQDALAPTRGLNCQGGVESPAVVKGLQWLATNMDKIGNNKRYRRDFPYSTLYTFERVGVAGGFKYIGDVDWFTRGADWLIKTQQADGAWPGKPTDGAPVDQWLPGVPDACFSILFLARGRSPVVMNKLQYGGEGKWNQRPRDVSNVVRWIGRQSERNLNWQVVNLKAGGEDDLNDAPILYIAGSEALAFTADEQVRLRRFVEQGGMILGNADCASKDFTSSFYKLGKALFPSQEFRKLPADHVIYRGQQYDASKWKTPPGLVGLSNGVRELMLLAPDTDPAKTWTIAGSPKPEPDQLAANLYLYATDRKSLERGQTYLVKRDEKIKPTRTVRVARLQYPGNWDPEPGGWRRLAAILHNQHKVDINVEPVTLGDGKLSDFKLAHLTGTQAIKLDEKRGQELKQFVSAGGTLVIDAAGGSKPFAEGIEKTLAALFTDAPKPLAPSHDLFRGMPAAKYRRFAGKSVGKLNAPRLQAIEMGGRLAVVYSPDDLSAGLVGEGVDGILGYEASTAVDLMSRIVLHAAGITARNSNNDGLD